MTEKNILVYLQTFFVIYLFILYFILFFIYKLHTLYWKGHPLFLSKQPSSEKWEVFSSSQAPSFLNYFWEVQPLAKRKEELGVIGDDFCNVNLLDVNFPLK